MRKILHVATRDFLATVSTKGFIIAVLVPPVIYGVLIVVFPRIMNNRAPNISGEVAVIDPTGEVFDGVQRHLSPEAIAGRRAETMNRALSDIPMSGQGARAAELAMGEVPRLTAVSRPASALLEEKDALKGQTSRRLLALVMLSPDVLTPAGGSGRYGGYDVYLRGNLDDRIVREIRRAVEEAVVDARVRAEGLDRRHVDALTTVQRTRSISVTAQSESTTVPALNSVLPVGFAVLLMISVMSSGQYLLTTTIEEKSSRTMEVILSAVSPLQLMAGKILGQLGVGLVILVLYSAMGIAALFSMALLGLLDFSLLAYLLIFFLITYITIGSMMAAVGSAVNELREAQTLMMPITMTVMLPWLFWLPITRDPNSLFSTVLSFVPPMNAFGMLLRMTSTSPPPAWQAWLSIGIGAAAACGALWFASRVFRIGLLMHGRPPNIATLIRWAREG
jgi:ABC-2 type transport system permease protein